MSARLPTIREIRLPDDEPAILSFLHGLQDYEAEFEPNRRRDPEWAVEHWREAQHRCAERHGIMLIAEDGGKPVGWAFAHDARGELFVIEAERNHGFLAELFVIREARGKGHGRALMDGCADWARQRGHKVLMVGVQSPNALAIRSYEGAGFAPYALTMRRYL
jgi:GNAT superfamily N-acetyltransferase